MSRKLVIFLVLLALAVTAMSFYGIRLHRRTQAHVLKAAEPVPVQPSEPQTLVTLMVADDETASVNSTDVAAELPAEPTQRARALLRTLLRQYAQSESHHPLPSTADVSAVYLLPDNTAVVDFNEVMAKTHPSGIMSETLTLTSMVQTLHVNFPKIQRVHFLVAGAARETLAGHADLSTDYPVP
jgi:spore germination protein GerM